MVLYVIGVVYYCQSRDQIMRVVHTNSFIIQVNDDVLTQTFMYL